MSAVLPVCLERIQRLGHRVFTSGDFNLNLFGIRASERRSGTFDDLLGCAYKDNGGWRVRYWPATTDPGWFYLESASERFGVDGTAILCPGQHLRAWKIGHHGRTRYDALIQTCGEVSVFRDATRDSILDMNPENITSGWFGINIHACSLDPYNEDQDRTDAAVGPWSAGCQVHATNRGFRDMMSLCKAQVAKHPQWQTFSYTLLDQWW